MPSLPRVAIPFNLTPFPLMLLNVILVIVLARVSFAEGERYGNSLFIPHYRTGHSPADSQGIGHLYGKLSYMRRADS
jgi:hypothetical protein